MQSRTKKNPKPIPIDLPEQVQVILFIMDEDGVKISCKTISDPKYWVDAWTSCPLCDAKQDSTGLIIHSYEH